MRKEYKLAFDSNEALEAAVEKLLLPYPDPLIAELEAQVDELNAIIVLREAEIESLTQQLADCEATQPPEPETYFRGNFEPPVTVTEKKIWGWDELDKLVSQGFAHNGSKAHVFEDIRDYNGKKILYAEVINDDPNISGTTRFQWSIFLKERMNYVHFGYKLFLSPALAHLSQHPDPMTWFTIIEVWNEKDPTLGEGSSPYNGSCRWNININKDKGVGSPLYFTLDGEKMQPLAEAHQDIFPKQKSNVVVNNYLGEWLDLDFYIKKGQTDGNIIFKLGGTEIFNFTGLVGYPNRPQLDIAFGGQAVNVFKLYTSDKILDWMRGAGKKVFGMYDEFKWYKT
jgi:hypothetical protein